ncbi:pancreatic lipase-related protein 2-like [Pseudophryne corroboree]|uniref:pancreatic lipase-related protein 2-like n=1 Tax=Pseudophryne corroboree TaxID=495146 RepID=UPI003081F064
MGHYSDSLYNISDKRQTFYLNTGPDLSHLSSWRYKVSVTLRRSSDTYGNIHISLFGSEGNITDHKLFSGKVIPENTYSAFIDSGLKLHPIDTVTFRWTPLLSNVFQMELGAERIDIQAGEDGRRSSFCTTGTVRNNVVQTLDPCRE